MAKTVNSAFTEFNNNIVNLSTIRSQIARSSRDWLIKQLEKLPDKDIDFPQLYYGRHIQFGSFARHTKIRPLDDIDLILTFHAEGTTYRTYLYGQSYSLLVPEAATKLKKLCNAIGTLNSKMLVNKLVSSLKSIEHYKSAEIHRRQEAATLQLSTYEWNFDIVPAFYTDTGYYLIPSGNGGWKATDPRVDQSRITSINQKHNGRVLQIIRTLKYWNNHVQISNIPSYLFENIVLNYIENQDEISDYIDINMINFWLHLKSTIYNSVKDPKGFQSDLNTLSLDEKNKISKKASDSYNKGLEAYNAEVKEENTEKAMNIWRQILGDRFPKYE